MHSTGEKYIQMFKIVNERIIQVTVKREHNQLLQFMSQKRAEMSPKPICELDLSILNLANVDQSRFIR